MLPLDATMKALLTSMSSQNIHIGMRDVYFDAANSRGLKKTRPTTFMRKKKQEERK